MSPVFLGSRPTVFFDPADFEDIDAILHYDDDPKHSTHMCMNCKRMESPDNVCLTRSLTSAQADTFSEAYSLRKMQGCILL